MLLAVALLFGEGFVLHVPQRSLRSVTPPPSVWLAEPPPPEVLEAEANATPNRKWRLAGAGAGFGFSALSGVVSLASLLGITHDFDAILPFDNAILSLVIDSAIGGSCAWAWQQEQKTKEQNIERIWEEVRDSPRTHRTRKPRAPRSPPTLRRAPGATPPGRRGCLWAKPRAAAR